MDNLFEMHSIAMDGSALPALHSKLVSCLFGNREKAQTILDRLETARRLIALGHWQIPVRPKSVKAKAAAKDFLRFKAQIRRREKQRQFLKRSEEAGKIVLSDDEEEDNDEDTILKREAFAMYMKRCEELKIIPCEKFIEAINTGTGANLRLYGLGFPGIDAVSVAVKHFCNLVVLDVAENRIQEKGVC